MLPRPHRLTDSAEFGRVTRNGLRARSGGLIVYLVKARPSTIGAARVGLIVGKSVGNSVVRHTVSRRLRALLAQRYEMLSAGEVLVVRALPESATAPSVLLAADLDRSLHKLGRTGS